MSKLISIVIPMYNADKYISKLLDCVINQTYKNFEVIIVNDGSTDNSREIVESYANKDERIMLINTPNGGVSRARNIGLENVTGEYVTFLDADDYIELDMYEKIMQKFEETNADVIRSNFIKEDEEGSVIGGGNVEDTYINNDEIKDKLIPLIFENKFEAYTPLLCIKADIIKKLKPFREDIHMMEDMLFYLDLLLNVNNIYLYDYKCYHYIVHMSSSSKRRNNLLRNFNDTIRVVGIAKDILNKIGVDEKIYKQVNYIYSTMIVKYSLRFYQAEDEYTLSFDELKELLDEDKVIEIIGDVDFPDVNLYIKEAGKLIKERKYKELYDYAHKVSDVKI